MANGERAKLRDSSNNAMSQCLRRLRNKLYGIAPAAAAARGGRGGGQQGESDDEDGLPGLIDDEGHPVLDDDNNDAMRVAEFVRSAFPPASG